MSDADGSMLILDCLSILAVLVLVAANGFFVAAEFSLVAVRRSRVAELVAVGRRNAPLLRRAVDDLDAHLAATQLGVTISSLALGWIGEPALSRLIEPALVWLPGSFARAGAHALSVAIAFVAITALHIVLGELAPKSLALQRSETTALGVVRPLSAFLFMLRPAIATLNGLGNFVIRTVGLKPGESGETPHSAQELKILVEASQDAGLLDDTQEEVMVRAIKAGERRIGDIMTPRRDVEWIDVAAGRQEMVAAIRASRHDQLLVGGGTIDAPLGMVLKTDLLNQLLDGREPDPMAALRQPLVVHEATPLFKVLEQFKRSPVCLAIVLDEYGNLEGIATQTDLLEAFAGDLPDGNEEVPDIVEREDGTLVIDGLASVHEIFDRLGIRLRPDRDVHTIAGFILTLAQHVPEAGETFGVDGWRFSILAMDGRRIDRLEAKRATAGNPGIDVSSGGR